MASEEAKESVMVNDRKRARLPEAPRDLSWITDDGSLDLKVFPIESVLLQAHDPNPSQFRTACSMLGSMAGAGRIEAGVHLLGLLQFFQDDLVRLTEIVDNLRSFRTPESVRALVNELHRVESSNTTRRYLDSVLHSLSRFPRRLVEQPLLALAENRSFSPKMRAKIERALDECFGNRRDEI
jgi:hypothetical protein